jgi:hypothetical protein
MELVPKTAGSNWKNLPNERVMVKKNNNNFLLNIQKIQKNNTNFLLNIQETQKFSYQNFAHLLKIKINGN